MNLVIDKSERGLNIETKTSYGIILFFNYKNMLKFLLIRRKDSIEYVNFIRGSYSLNNIGTIQKMINLMTMDEINKIKTLSFEELWENLWMKSLDMDNLKVGHRKNYEKALHKFTELKNSNMLDNMLDSYTSNWVESEWGFPKGRKNPGETEIQTAIREFSEETNINTNYYIILNSKKFIEEYIGSDGKKYRHIYYLAKYTNIDVNLSINPLNRAQITEIGCLKFLTLEEACHNIRYYHVEKKKILLEASKYIIDNELFKLKPYSINKNL